MSIELLNKEKLLAANIEHFPDKTSLIRVGCSEDDFPNSVTVRWDYDSDAEITYLFYITRHLQEHGVKNIDLLMPYIPNARFDRVNNKDEVFTLKYFAEIINSLHFNHVYVLDAHSNVSLALINKVKQINVKPVIQETIKDFKPDVLFMPDEGAHKRYGNMFDMPSTFGIKTRDWRTGDIKNYSLADPESVKDKRVLIIDDISSKGGTFYHAGQLLHRSGAKAIGLYISHCEETIIDGKVLNESESYISKVYTADPLWNEPQGVSVLNNIKIVR